MEYPTSIYILPVDKKGVLVCRNPPDQRYPKALGLHLDHPRLLIAKNYQIWKEIWQEMQFHQKRLTHAIRFWNSLKISTSLNISKQVDITMVISCVLTLVQTAHTEICAWFGTFLDTLVCILKSGITLVHPYYRNKSAKKIVFFHSYF